VQIINFSKWNAPIAIKQHALFYKLCISKNWMLYANDTGGSEAGGYFQECDYELSEK
jgi:hypothetical protein